MKAVILAGGKGTRLASLTREIPKPMLPILGKPLLEYQLELLHNYGITEVIILVNYLKDSIIQHIGNGEKWGMQIEYFEEKEPLGTTGGIRAIKEKLTDDFMVLYGDVLMNLDLHRLIRFHQQHQPDATLVLHPNDHPHDSDLVELNEQKQITAFFAKPHPQDEYRRNLVNAGLYILSPKIIDALPEGKAADFGRDIFPEIVQQYLLVGYNTSEYLKDMGTPDRLKKVEEDVLSGKVKNSSYEHPQKAIFLDRDGVLNDDTEFIHRAEDIFLYDDVPQAVRTINQSGYKAIVITNQSVVARNLCTEKELREIHNKIEVDLSKAQAWLDEIYYCPHHPDKGFPDENPLYKLDCECRKPKPGMLLQAAQDFHINLHESWMIGDNERDIEAGKAAGCKMVGVATGKGLKKTTLLPDYFFFNLQEAVDFIVHEPYKKLAEEITHKIHQHSDGPFVISIGGNSQSGKSTLATYLRDYLKKYFSVITISLDDWILPAEERSASHDVMEVFQTQKIQEQLTDFFNGASIQVAGYARHHLREAKPASYTYQQEKVILIEGVVALEVPVIREQSALKLFKDISFSELEKRILRLHRWKDRHEKEVHALWEERKEKEYLRIEKGKDYADQVV